MAYPTILQTIILATVVLDLNMAMPTTMPTTPLQKCGECSVDCYSGPGRKKCTADCPEKILDEVPNECNYVRNLQISDNFIDHITRTSFQSFHQLELLKIKNNGITGIDIGSFAETRLGTIDLSNNELESLHKDVFLNLTTLTHLKLAANRIESIQEYNLPNLTWLDMSHNRIEEIHRGSFAMMTNIKHLYLSQNHISQLKSNFLGNDMIHLITLDLSGNNINSINLNAFHFLTNLEKLDLSGNDITDRGFPHSPGALFENQSHLKFLFLSNNRISHLQKYMLEGLEKNLTEFSADHNQISAVEEDIFKLVKFRNLTKLNLTHNELDANFSKEFVPLLESQPTPKIVLEENPLCEEYQTVFRGQYNRYIFCSTKQMNKYIASEEHTATSELTPTQIPNKLKQEYKEQDILKLVCIISAGVLGILLIVLAVVWIKSQKRRTGNYTTCVTNRGYQYPSDRISEPETAPPPIPSREPLLDEAYANTTLNSYVAPNNPSTLNGHPPAINRHQSSTNGHSPSTNRHSPSSHRHCPSSHRHSPSSHRHSPSSHRHSPSSHRNSPSTHRYSFRRSILKRLPSISHRPSSDQPIVVIGTSTGTTGTARIEGLPPCKSVNKTNMSNVYKKPKKSTEKSEEEGAYMIRDETEDGKPKNATMASYRSVQD